MWGVDVPHWYPMGHCAWAHIITKETLIFDVRLGHQHLSLKLVRNIFLSIQYAP